MGLLLSVLVVCVGVLEVIACVRHFQDGYLPLWTPHCAVTSGYAKTHELWRNKPSDSYEFRSTNDVSGAFNHAQDQSPETFSQPSVSVENGYTVKHEFEDTRQEVIPSKEFLPLSDATLSSFKDEKKIENVHGIDISPTLGTEESDLDLISTYDKQLDVSVDDCDERKEISTNYTNSRLISELVDKHSENIGSHYEELLQTADNIPLSCDSEEAELDVSPNKEETYPKIDDGLQQVSQVSSSNENAGLAGQTSNILSEKYTVADVYNVNKLSDEETTPHEIFNEPEKSRFEYDLESSVKSVDESSYQGQDTKESNFQEEVIPQSSSIEAASQDAQLSASAPEEYVDLGKIPNEATELETGITSQHSKSTEKEDSKSESIEEIPNESVDVGGITSENTELETDLISEHSESIKKEDTKSEPTEEKPYVPLSDIQTEFEIPSNIHHEQSLEELSTATNVPESQCVLGTEIQEEHNTSSQKEIDIAYNNKEPVSIDIDEDILHSRESTPQIYQEYVPLTSEQIKSEIPTGDTSESRLEDHGDTSSNPETTIEESQDTSVTEIIADTSKLESEDRSQQELGDISKYDEFEALHDSKGSETRDEDREGTPQPIFDQGDEITLSLQKNEPGNQLEISNHPSNSKPESVSLLIEREEATKPKEKDTSASRLESQTTFTETVVSKNEDSDEVPQVVIAKSDIIEEISKHPAASPLTIDTTEESPPVTTHPSHQSSVSPPQLPSTPTKKSRADISWPTFFPGAPVIKRPSVSFATPEAVFTNEDQELLRQYAEEATDITPCLKKSDDTRGVANTEHKTPSLTEDKSLESQEALEKNDSFEEDFVPITFKERSPSNIVAGNDFSRKELQLQKRKSYKHKRYSSASELNTKEEEAEDTSFSENKSSIVRASSLKESRRRLRKPAKASSFEDVMLLETSKTQEEGYAFKKTADASNIPVIEEKETECQRDRAVSVRVATEEEGGDFQKESNQRNESNVPKPENEIRMERNISEPDSRKEGKEEDEEESSYSVSEEQSSSQQKSATKEAFWLIFSGEYTKAMSKDWHTGHFCCWQCDESLTGQRYVLRDDHPYCIKCYESVFANVCEECNKTIGIDSKDLSYKDKHWHEACFLCNKCRVSLVDKQFGSKADKIYCGNCYDAQFASRCDGCGEIFRAGTKKMEYKTRQWHEKCFCCCVCKTAIGTKSFIPREQEIYCATCYEEKFATRCVKCNKIITSGGVTYKNEPWHRECFTCTNCNTSLAGQRFTSRDEKPYCADCFGELFAKRCTACSKPITGIGGTRFISFEDRHWHNDCFICATCKTSLVGRGFITDADDIICPECAKQKLM